MKALRGILIIQSALALSICIEAKAQIDSLRLDSTVFSAARRQLVDIVPGQVTTVDMAELAAMPSVLGNSDPLHFVQMLPSMQTSSEIDAGIHIQGCDHQHNLVALDGVPIYGASHLMGIFSVFNPTHYRSMSYSTTAVDVNRLGGVIDMHTRRTVPKQLGLDASVGLVSAQGTLELPLSSKSALTVSGRGSLVDLLYGNYLRIEKVALSYGFSDVNVSWLWTPTAEDRISADFYYGCDGVVSDAGEGGMSLDMGWNNLMGALHWTHGDFQQSAYYTRYTLNAEATQAERTAHLPSSIATAGYRCGWNSGQLKLLADVAMHDILPQDPQISGAGIEYEPQEMLRSFESTVTAGWSGAIGYNFEYSATLGAQWFLSAEKKSYFGLSPQLAGIWHLDGGDKIRVNAGVHRQYLFQTGLSNLGLPFEFWLPAGKYGAPQWSVGASVAWNKPFEAFELDSELYGRYLGNQLEYVSSFQDIILGGYSLENSLRKGTGYAYGVNLMLRKTEGKLTGWAGLSVGRSMRVFDEGTYPSNHERIVELNMVGSYKAGRWDLGATLVAAGGTPFTEVREYYMVSNTIISIMEPRNSGRLRPYFRLDLNARLNFNSRGRVRHGLNFSVYNATAQNQEIYRSVKFDRELMAISYERMYLGITILPSVGYFIKF